MKRCFCFGAMDFTRFDEKIKDGDIVSFLNTDYKVENEN